jgi:hypothetical protein
MSPNNRPHLLSPLLAGAVLMFVLPLSAQAASYTYTAPAWAYREPLTAANLPKLGTKFKVLVPDGYPSQSQTRTYYLLATGLTNPKVTIPGLGTVLTSAEILTWVPSGTTSPYLQMSFKIPNSSQLVGLRFYQQVLATQYYKSGAHWCEPNCWTKTGQYLSRGGVGVIGR